MSAEKLFSEANELFVDEDFHGAVQKYTETIKIDPKNPEFYLKRSQCYIKLNEFNDALTDATTALSLDPNSAKALLRKGTALFHLEEYESAKDAFERGQSIEPQQQFKTWIRKCVAELESENSVAPQIKDPIPISAETSTLPIEPKTTSQSQSHPQVNNPPAAKVTRYRHEWYQTPTHVIVTIFIKNVRQDDASIEIAQRKVSVLIKLPESNEYQLNLKLCDEVIPTETITQFLSTKIEIKLRKAVASQWVSLESTGDPIGTRPWEAPSSQQKPSYPSSSLKKKNWDEVAQSIPEDKLEGEEGLNKVFQDIYANGTDEQKRAMMKSFTESGGTVLSTNWDDVRKKHVDGSPPKGMEMHNWNEINK